MTTYSIRRILIMIPTVLIISIIVFTLIQLPPGDYVESLIAKLKSQGMDVGQEQISRLRRRYGLDDPFYSQYFKWISGFVVGDFGISFLYEGKKVSDIIYNFLGFTVLLAASTQLFIIIVGIPIGIYSATHQYSLSDQIFTFFGFIGLSIPNFLLALILMFVAYFSFNIPVLGGLFSEQYINAAWSWGRFVDLLAHLWIPVIVLGTAGTAGTIRTMRANLLDVLKMQYVNTARAKGLKENVVIYKHAVRNALHPIIMGLGSRLPKLLSGSTIVSIVLSLPTLGPTMLKALKMQDMYLAGTILLFQCILLLLGNFIADIALVWVDPRIDYS